LSPINPFITDLIYKNLTKEESVHLSAWPESKDLDKYLDQKLLKEMEELRLLVEKAHAQRKEKTLPVKQPLAEVVFVSPLEIDENLFYLALEELNVKKITLKKGEEASALLDTQITPELLEEAKARDLIRSIQEERKTMGLTLNQSVKVSSLWIPQDSDLLEKIKSKTMTDSLIEGEFKVTAS